MADTLRDKFHVKMGGDDSAMIADDDDPLQGTSEFGGATPKENRKAANDSFDEAFDKADGENEEELEDFMVAAKPKRPQWG